MADNKVEHTERRELAVVRRGKILSGQVDEWRNEQLYINPLPPTNLQGCHIISVSYDVYVSSRKIYQYEAFDTFFNDAL